MAFDNYIREIENIGKRAAFDLSIKLRSVLLFWYFARVCMLFWFRSIEFVDFITFFIVLASMAINLFFWSKRQFSDIRTFYFFSFLESFLIVYSAVFLDDMYLLFLLAGSNSMTIFTQNRNLTFWNGVFSVMLYTLFSVYKNTSLVNYFFSITVLFTYFKINYFIVSIIGKYREEIKTTHLSQTFDEVARKLFFHNTFTTHGHYTFESQVLQNEEFGGDFVAITPLPDGEIIGVVGDIGSHGNEVFPGAVVSAIVFKALASQSTTQKDPKAIITCLNEVLGFIDEKHGGNGLFFVFYLTNTGEIVYVGGLFDGSFQINNRKISLQKISIIGHKEAVDFKPVTRQLYHGDRISITTDGWGGVYSKLDDKTKLKITYFGLAKKPKTKPDKKEI